MQFRGDHETISLCRHAAPIAGGNRHLTDKVNGAVGRSLGGRTDERACADGRRATGSGAQVTQSATRARVGWGSVISPRRLLGHVRNAGSMH